VKQDFIISNQKLAQVFKRLYSEIKVGQKLSSIEEIAWKLIEKQGGEPNFARVPGYDWATCINVNEGIVHGIPNDYQIKDGDLVSVDMGLIYNGWHSDMAYTKYVSNNQQIPEDIERFLNAGKQALKQSISVVKPGNRVGHISEEIQSVIEENDYVVIQELTGHGIGKELHQAPNIPGAVFKPIEKTRKLEPGMGLAIEVIYTLESPGIKTEDDGWTISTTDGKISALFEQTVLVTQKGNQIVTPYLFSQQGGNGGN
jgi:methionyl aminopeptidase